MLSTMRLHQLNPRDSMGRQDWASYKADGLLRSHRPHESLCENLRISSSGAKARWIVLTLMSDLKVRPPVAAPAPLPRILTKLGPQGYSVLRSEEHTSELQSLTNLVCRLLLEKKNLSSTIY